MTSLPELSIRRPVFAWMLMIGLVLFGAISFRQLGISQMPDVDFPVLSISVVWEGAAPEVMEAELADRLEQAVVSVQGLREISSSIRQGQVTLTLEFELSRDIDAALQEVQSAISQVRLPTDVDPPTIKKTNPEDQPIMWLGLSSKTRTNRDLIVYTDLHIKDQFQIIPGVGEVLLGGYTDRNLRIWVDNKKLRQNELTILDIRDTLRQQHLETAAGRIENDSSELNLRVMGEGFTPEDIGKVLITTRGGKPIYSTNLRLRDVARIEDGLADVRRISRINGETGLGLGIKKQRGANSVEVGNRILAKMEEVKKTLPEDISIGVNFDTTVFVKDSVEETEFTLVLSALATAIVCWLFLGSLRPTFNILLSIPTSIVGTFSIIYFMGFTLNFFTILGLALAIGIVVDDAIMVLENIYRHKAMGKSKYLAAKEGTEEITFAAIAATVAVIAIFLPIAFMKGIIGKFFFQFAVTITAAVALSLLEAVTLTPMRCSQMLGDKSESNFFSRFIDRCFMRVAALYRAILRICLKVRWLVILVSIGIFAASLSLVGQLRKEFIPAQDQSMFIMRMQTPVGSSLEATGAKVKEVEQLLLGRPEVRRIFAAIGGFGGGEVNTGMLFVSMKGPKDRKGTQADFMEVVRQETAKLKDVKVFIQDLSTRGFTAQRGMPVEFNIRGSEWKVLEENANKIIAELDKTGLVADIDTDYRLGQPEVRVIPLRDQAAARGISVQTITDTVSAAMGGIREGKYTQDGRRYDVRLRLQSNERVKADDIMALQVRNQFGELVPISEVVKIETQPTLQTITRRNRERSISIFANVAKDQSQSAALEKAEEVSRQILPPGYSVHLSGGAQTFVESFQSLIFVLWLGLLVAYMVLASQFNSYLHPFTVLLALPFSLTGALVALYLTNQSMNLYSMIGVVLLMGIVKKNSILLVEFFNHKRDLEGLELTPAILEAAPIRLRPILMTSMATIAAALPPALAIGPGAESRIPMSITIVGGVLVSTVFTLFVIPCAYSLLARLERRKEIDFSKSPEELGKSSIAEEHTPSKIRLMPKN